MNPPGEGPRGAALAPTMSSAMAGVTRYHEYLWSHVRPRLGARVMEIGVGYGQYTRRMIGEGRRVLGCDLDPGHLDDLQRASASPLLLTLRLDLEDPAGAREVAAAFRPDTVVLLNVLEHIGAHELALAFLREVAAPGAALVLIVPAMQALYNGLDAEAGHRRRYSRRSLAAAAQAAGWRVELARYINLPGVPGWIAAGWLSRMRRSGSQLDSPSTNGLLRLYDRFFVGLSRLSDPACARIAGLSVLCVGRNGGPSPALERTRA